MAQKKAAKKAAKKGAKKAAKPAAASTSASKEIDARFKELADWRGEMLSHLRALIKKADPDVLEEIKWRKATNPDGVPVWSHAGMICTGETYKDHVKLTFANGGALKDPKKVFNTGFGGTRRAIDLYEGDAIDDAAFIALIGQAVALNEASQEERVKRR